MKQKLTVLIAALVLGCSSFAGAELYAPHRWVEISVDLPVGVSNNTVDILKIFQKKVTLDMDSFINSVPANGFSLNPYLQPELYLNMNFGQKCRISAFAGVEVNGAVTIGKDLLSIVNGISSNESLSADLGGTVSVFANTGVSFGTKIGKLMIKVAPAAFMPLAYAKVSNGKITYYSDNSGMNASATADVNMYSFMSLSSLSNGISVSDLINAAENGLYNFGVDITANAEYPVFKSLDLGLTARVPVVPGKMPYSASTSVSVSASANVLNAINTGSTYTLSDAPYYSALTYGTSSYTINRPMRFNMEGRWVPFGNWLELRPSIGVAFSNPFGADYDWAEDCYCEYGMYATFNVWKIMGLTFGTAYTGKVFSQSVGMNLNLRLLEVVAKVATEGSDFANSWNITGIGAFVGVRVGF